MAGGILARLRKNGFEGPFYSGIPGKARFVIESTIGRSDLIFTATPQSLAHHALPAEPDVQLHLVRDFAGFAPFVAEFEAEYYRGYAGSWKAPFTWGEQAVVGTVGGRVASIAWLQLGTAEGYPTYYGCMFEREARILRVGVVPSFRRQGVNTVATHRILQRLFAAGVQRVYIECHKYNVPSIRTFTRVGFTPVGIIRVIELPGLRRFVRWTSAESAAAEFRSLGIDYHPSSSHLGTPALP
jgi:RimJ/RimL family protein N-acetyltransferase